jgi:hypothetical protein
VLAILLFYTSYRINRERHLDSITDLRYFDGKICCLRVTKMHTYKRRTEYPKGSGIYYEAGDERRVDDTMGGDKFADILINDVFPTIRTKLAGAKTVSVQYDNAGGHGIKELLGRISAHLPAPMRRGKQVGPEIKIVPQCAQSPCTRCPRSWIQQIT